MSADFPPIHSFTLVRSTAGDPIQGIVQAFSERAVEVTRDVIIGPPEVCPDLVGQADEFWFHTDGVFLDHPPRWVIVQILEAKHGGQLQVVNATGLHDKLPPGDVLFGNSRKGVIRPLVTNVGDERVIRYRQDYMHQIAGGADIETAHLMVREHAREHATPLSPLEPYDCLVLDNWYVMHRRKKFTGRRIIRRIWLS